MTEYHVQLLMGHEAASPLDAVGSFIEALVQGGLRDWAYIVRDSETGEEFVFNGYGMTVSVPEDDDEDPVATEAFTPADLSTDGETQSQGEGDAEAEGGSEASGT